MPKNLLQSGAEHLASTMRKHAGVDVTYSRGQDSCDVVATVGITSREIQSGGATVRWESRDFLVAPDELRLSEGLILPQEGDTITERTCAGESVYVVAAIPGEKHWRWSGPHRSLMRIHTARASREQA